TRRHSRLPADPRDRALRPTPPTAPPPEHDRVPRWLSAAVLGVLLVCVALVRLRLAGAPLERDEGEYGYAGQLLLQGVAPYQLAYNMKFPGTYYVYSVMLALFGHTAWAIHIGLLITNACTTLALFFLARRLTGERAALIAAIAFAVLSLDRWIMGPFAHATHFVILPAIAGLLLLDRGVDSRRPMTFLAAGVLLGTSVLMKQHAAVFVALGMGLVLWRDPGSEPAPLAAKLRRAGMLALGALAPF